MRRIVELESLRGVMAGWVVVGHVLKLVEPPGGGNALVRLLERNDLAVEVFIILSGFVIFSLLDNSSEGYWRFLMRRFMRLFPAYIVCFSVACVLAPWNVAALQGLPWQSDYVLRSTRFLTEAQHYLLPNIATHLVMLQGLVPASLIPYGEFAFLSPAWSISVEWQFYILAPLLFGFGAIKSPIVRAGLLLGYCAVYLVFGMRLGEGFLPHQLPFFFVGMSSYFLWKHSMGGSTLAPWLAGILVPFAMAASFMLVWHGISLGIWAVVFFSLLVDGSGRAGAIERIILGPLRMAPVRYIGRISYSLYLSHMIFIYLGVGLLNPFALDRGPYLILLLTGTVAASLGFSVLLFRFVEKPGIAWGRHGSTPLPQRA